MRRTAFHSPLRAFTAEETVDEAGGERVSSADTIENFQILPIFRLVEIAARVADRAPVIYGRSLRLAQGCGNHGKGKFFHHRLNHLLERFSLDIGNMLIESGHLKTQRSRKIFFIAKHDVDQWGQLPIHVLCALLAANRLPKRFTVIQIVGDNGSVLPRRFHRFESNFRRALRQSAEDPSSMKPAYPTVAKDFFPVDVSRFQLRDRRVPTVRASQCRSHAKSSYGKVQTVSCGAPDTVEIDPANQRLIDTSLINKVLQQASDWII